MRIIRALALAFLAAAALSPAAADVAPAITTQPASQTVAPGGAVQFQAAASGTAPLVFQWFFGTTPILNATNAALGLTNVSAANVGAYYLVVTNAAGSAESTGATLELTGPPVIVTAPAAQSAVSAASVTFAVRASGTPPLTYQWFGLGKALAGATNASLVLTNVTPTNAGPYAVLVSNTLGSARSTNAMLDVAGPPYFTQAPASTFVYYGETASFSGAVYSTTPVTYQWVYGSGAIGGATTNTLQITNVSSASVGYYYLIAGNQYGSVESTGGYLDAGNLPQPGLRLGPPVFSSNTVSAPVLFTAYGIETNVQFSLFFNASALTNPAFSLNSTNVPGAMATVTPASGALGVVIQLGTNQTFAVGETNVGAFSAAYLPGATNLFAAGLGIGGSPTAVAVSPLTTNYTNVVVSPLAPVLTGPPQAPVLNPQTGLLEQRLEVANAGGELEQNALIELQGLGVDSLTNAIVLENAQAYISGTNPAVVLGPLAPAERRGVTLEYYVSDRSTLPAPTFLFFATPYFTFTVPTTSAEMVSTHRQVSGGLLIDFSTQTNQFYYVQYADSLQDLTNASKARISLPVIIGTGGPIQWLDDGPPKTISPPSLGARFYQILRVTATNVVGVYTNK